MTTAAFEELSKQLGAGRRTIACGIALLAHLFAGVAVAGDAALGKVLFGVECASCHSAEPDDNGGNQGPSLRGLLGRHAAGDPEFSYTKELREADFIWDDMTLERFIAAPEEAVPGTAMNTEVRAKADRENLVAYFQSIAKTESATATPSNPAPPTNNPGTP